MISELVNRVTLWSGSAFITVEAHEDDVSLCVRPGSSTTSIIHIDAQNITATEGFMLVDLSDTTNWPHSNTGHIDLVFLAINVNPSTAFRGDVEIGFLSSVDADNGDFNVIDSFHFQQQGSALNGVIDHTWHHVALETTSWFGPTEADDVTWRTGLSIQGPDGATSYPSGDGDMVMKITLTAGNVDVGITIVYDTEA